MSIQVACIGQPVADTTVSFPTWSFGVGVGITTLPSLQTTYRFQKQWAIRAGYEYMGYNPTNWKFAHDKIVANVQVRLSRLVLLGRYSPFRTEKFGILAGLAIFPTKTVTTLFRLAENIQLDGLLITPDAVGTGLFKLGYQNPFAPYIGLTFGRPVPTDRYGWQFEIGTYYAGAFEFKQLTIDSKIFLKENEANIGILERNLNRLPLFYRLIPDLKMVWVYRI